jgi:hypothetical protein
MINKTVGSAGADYTTWQNGFNANADAADDITFTAITADDLGPLNANVSNVNNKRYICDAQEAVCFRSAASWPDMSASIAQSARIGGLLTIAMAGVEVYNLHVTGGIDVQASCILGNVIGSGSTSGWQIFHNAGGDILAYNCAFLANAGLIFNNGGTATFYYCAGCYSAPVGSFGFWQQAGTVTCYGCIAKNYAFNDFNGGVGGNQNVSGDATAPGATNWQNQTGIFVSEGVDLHLDPAKFGDYPTSDYTGSVPAVAFDIDNDARPTGSDAGVDASAATDPPDASYAPTSISCEAAHADIAPTNVGGAITAAALAGGSPALPAGVTLNANGTLSINPALMVAGGIGSRTLSINLSNAAGADAENPRTLPLTILPNPPVGHYAGSPFVAPCRNPVEEVIGAFTHDSGPAVAAGTFVLVTPMTHVTVDASDGDVHLNPTRADWGPPTPLQVSFQSAGGQVGTAAISVEFDFQFVVNLNGGETWNVTMPWLVDTGGGSDASDDHPGPDRWHRHHRRL